jgi:hypothetical protein
MFALRGLLAVAATLVGVVAAAQNSSAIPSTDELLLILEKLPTCVVSIDFGIKTLRTLLIDGIANMLPRGISKCKLPTG